MARRKFLTVADELLVCAEAVADHLASHGYRIRIEHREVDYPYTPTLHCYRRPTTLFVEVDRELKLERLDEWVRFSQSCGRDTRVAVCVPEDFILSSNDEAQLRQRQVGLFRLMSGTVVDSIPAMDLALHVSLPPLTSLDPRIRAKLGPTYEKFDRSEWRDAFKAACQLVEAEARRYLIAGLKRRKLTFVDDKGKVYSLTGPKVRKMTLGALGRSFAEIQKQNHADRVIATVLELINPERVGATHFEALGKTETKLRQNVGRHMYRLIAALKELLAP